MARFVRAAVTAIPLDGVRFSGGKVLGGVRVGRITVHKRVISAMRPHHPGGVLRVDQGRFVEFEVVFQRRLDPDRLA
jgi:hypothetical protein